MNAKTLHLASRSARMLVLGSLWAIGTSAAHAQSAGAPAPVHWAKVSVSLPVDGTIFPPGAGSRIATENCLICHTADMVLLQPPLTQAEWLGEIRKMRAFFGAPMPAAQDAVLAKYLAGINGPATPRPATAATGAK